MKWARESAGLDLKAVEKILNVRSSTIEEWEKEQGIKKPTLTTLEKLAYSYKRPLAAFFLPAPPEEPPMPSDFRVSPEKQRRTLSREARLAIRRARRVQALATELMEMEGTKGEQVANIGGASLSDDPERTAERERERITITVDDQSSFGSLYKAFDKWREALESFNIVVYQTRIPPEEARGFSLLDHMLPTIVVSISDAIAARIFTLFHEYAHLLLGVSGICIPNESSHDDANIQEIERFCNHFAGAFLVPRYALETDENAKLIAHQSDIDDSCLNEIARRFKVSRQVVLRRLLICEFISRQRYRDKLEELLTREKPQRRGFGVPPAKRCISENGRLFVSLALEATERELITYSDLADYLSINLKHIDEVETIIRK